MNMNQPLPPTTQIACDSLHLVSLQVATLASKAPVAVIRSVPAPDAVQLFKILQVRGLMGDHGGGGGGISPGHTAPLLVAVRAVMQERSSSNDGGGRQRDDNRKDDQGLRGGISGALPGGQLTLPGRLTLLCDLLGFDQSRWEQRARHDACDAAAALRHRSHVAAEVWRREVGDAVVTWLVRRLVAASDPSAFRRPQHADKRRGASRSEGSDSLLKDVVQGVAGLVSSSPADGSDTVKEDLSDQVRCPDFDQGSLVHRLLLFHIFHHPARSSWPSGWDTSIMPRS